MITYDQKIELSNELPIHFQFIANVSIQLRFMIQFEWNKLNRNSQFVRSELQIQIEWIAPNQDYIDLDHNCF